jgi:O-antigen/teichoic acid export membrane protein
MLFKTITGKIPNWYFDNFWNISALIGAKLGAFLILIVVTAAFSVEQFAMYSIFSAIIAFAAALLPLGSTMYIKDIFATKTQNKAYLEALGWQYIRFSALLATFLLLLLVYLNPFDYLPEYIYLFLLPAIFISGLISVCNSVDILYSDHRSRFVYFAIAPFVGLIFFVVLDDFFDIDPISSILLFSFVTYVIVFFSKRNNYIEAKTRTHDLDSFYSNVKRSSKYLMHGVAMLLLVSSDRIMLGLLSTDYETASYALVAQFGTALGAIAVICEAAYSRYVLRTGLKEKKEVELMTIMANLMPLAYLVGGIILAFAFKYSIDEKYQSSWYLLFPIMASYYVVWTYALTVNLLLANGLGGELRSVTVLWALVNLLLNYIYVSEYGALGAASTTFICFFGMTCHIYYKAFSGGCEMEVFKGARIGFLVILIATYWVVASGNISLMLVILLALIASVFAIIALLQIIKWRRVYV